MNNLSVEATKTLAQMATIKTAIRAALHAAPGVREELNNAGLTVDVAETSPGRMVFRPTAVGLALAAKLAA